MFDYFVLLEKFDNTKPQEQAVVIGVAAVIYCHFVSYVEWLFNNEPLSNDIATTKPYFHMHQLLIPSVSKKHIGTYMCFTEDTNHYTGAYSLATLRLSGKNLFLLHPQ